MKKKLFSLTAAAVLSLSFLFSSCKKNNNNQVSGPAETYRLTGRIDAARTTVATAAVTNASFTITYNTANSFGEAQSVLNGSFTVTGYTGLTASGGVADTLSFFATQPSGPAISYLTIGTSTFSSTPAVTTFYSYTNSATATFSYNNFPFSSEITSALKEGRGYFRMGKSPKYVYILLDGVTKL